MNIGLRFVLAFLSRVWKVRQPSAILGDSQAQDNEEHMVPG